MSFKRNKRSVKLLSDHPFLAFSFKRSSTECNNVNLSSQPIILSYKSSSLALFNPSKLLRPPLACSLSVFVTGNKIYMVGHRIANMMVAQDARNKTQGLDRFGPSR